jgi:ketosteroid isomerase-like protein
MTEQQTIKTLDFEALRHAAERNDAGALADHYAEDAEVLIVNRETPPSSPHVLRGKAQIAEFLEDACGRDIQSRIQDEVIGQGRVAFNEECEYPDGLKMLTATTLEGRKDRTLGQRRSLGRVGQYAAPFGLRSSARLLRRLVSSCCCDSWLGDTSANRSEGASRGSLCKTTIGTMWPG